MVDQVQVVVVATKAGSSDRQGALFEAFVARLLAQLGYEASTSSNLNVTSNGIELDVRTSHRLTHAPLIAECKAYSSNVPASTLDSFYGKLRVERFARDDTEGLFVAVPRLTANGEEQAALIEKNETRFRYLNADGIVTLLEQANLVTRAPTEAGLLSDPLILVTEDGVYQGARRLHADTRTAEALVLWGTGQVPDSVVAAIRDAPIAAGLPIVPLGRPALLPSATEEPVVARVASSSSDFEYQFPAAPRFFVGRARDIAAIRERLTTPTAEVFVLNAQSGWGKSSLALRIGAEVAKLRGRALIVDARTASMQGYVPAVLRAAAEEAAAAKLLKLPADAAFGTITSSLSTLQASAWSEPVRPVLVFFDQFENVFRDASLTRAFRDLALAVRDVARPLKIGFAWKTDLVGWTEGHPYQLRDEIRSAGTVVTLAPLGPSEISTLLDRLQRAVGEKLERDVRDRLREYSGGLPWLFKKLAGHVIDELSRGRTQQQLLAEALNVQGLFDADLAELGPADTQALREIARVAPVAISDVSDSVEMAVVQSLLDRRLIVQVGERLDTYWDIFRDYLNTGAVPIKDGFILRLNPSPSMGLLLRAALDGGGALSVSDAMRVLGTSEAVVFNTVRDLRLLGLVAYEPGTIRVPDAVLAATDDQEHELRSLASTALRRHRAYEIVVDLLDRSTGIVPIGEFSTRLAEAFPAVNAKPPTWDQYARAFAYWLAYAQLIGMTQAGITPDPRDTQTDLSLLTRQRRVSVSGSFPHSPAGPALEVALELAGRRPASLTPKRRAAGLGALEVLGLVSRPSRDVVVLDRAVFSDQGDVVAGELRQVLEDRVAGARDAIALIERDPAVTPLQVGQLLRDAQKTEWAEGTVHSAGKYFRSWARAAGVATSHAKPNRAPPPSLF